MQKPTKRAANDEMCTRTCCTINCVVKASWGPRPDLYFCDSRQPSTPIEATYFSMFSSAVPVQLVPSIWQAFHDGMARVAERISAMTSELSSSVSPTDDPSPALVVGSCGCAEPLLSLPLPGGGAARLKEPEASSKTPSDVIQSCQGKLREMTGEIGSNG